MNLTLEQENILKEKKWVFGYENGVPFAKNEFRKTIIFGSLVESFLQEEADELLSYHPYLEVENTHTKLSKAGYEILELNPLALKDNHGNITIGSCADWLLKEILSK